MHPHDAQLLARELMQAHNLAGWSFSFDHARRRFGSCRLKSKIITLSRPLTILNTPEQVRDTLLHEIAHALTPGDGHGQLWRDACRRIGAKPQRCYQEHEVMSPARPRARYRIGCQRCDWWADRRRRTRRKYLCAKCQGPIIWLEWVPNIASPA
ncbi:MAG TPA: SprT-like domain-containing protein [Tepidisphaeraceae bacterium]|jgi:predicted SprT family Zn-dependent metalloprotease